MGFPERNDRVNVNINGRTATIGYGQMASDIIRDIGETPENRSLVLHNNNGTFEQIPHGNRIEARDGQWFSTILNQKGG